MFQIQSTGRVAQVERERKLHGVLGKAVEARSRAYGWCRARCDDERADGSNACLMSRTGWARSDRSLVGSDAVKGGEPGRALPLWRRNDDGQSPCARSTGRSIEGFHHRYHGICNLLQTLGLWANATATGKPAAARTQRGSTKGGSGCRSTERAPHVGRVRILPKGTWLCRLCRTPPVGEQPTTCHDSGLALPKHSRQNGSMTGQSYKCRATNVAGFIQQLAVSCIARGYFFYVVGCIPEGKDPARVDVKLVTRYGLDLSKWARARRKRSGGANVQYIRHGRLFVLVATHGEHRLFQEEGNQIRDVRRVPLKAFGYAISHAGGRVRIRIEREEFKRLRAHLLDLSIHRHRAALEQAFMDLPYEPYAPVYRQLRRLLHAVNSTRRTAGLEPIPPEVLRRRRRIRLPFEDTTVTVEQS